MSRAVIFVAENVKSRGGSTHNLLLKIENGNKIIWPVKNLTQKEFLIFSSDIRAW